MTPSRRRFFGLVASAPLAITAAPAVVEMIAADIAPVLPRYTIYEPLFSSKAIARVAMSSVEKNQLVAWAKERAEEYQRRPVGDFGMEAFLDD